MARRGPGRPRKKRVYLRTGVARVRLTAAGYRQKIKAFEALAERCKNPEKKAKLKQYAAVYRSNFKKAYG